MREKIRLIRHYLTGFAGFASENGESDKLNGEPIRKDAETMVSLERLHMITRYNPLGSLHSLPRGSRARVSLQKVSKIFFIFSLFTSCLF